MSPPKAVKKKPEITPKSLIKSHLRLLFMRCIEKNLAIRRDKNTCQDCGVKGSQAKGKEVKTECHHTKDGDINWDRIEAVIREELLCSPDYLITLCKKCHYARHGKVLKEKKK